MDESEDQKKIWLKKQIRQFVRDPGTDLIFLQSSII